MVNKTIEKTGMLARGLFPPELGEKGLIVLLKELAENVSTQTGVKCTFSFQATSGIKDNLTLLHLMRIAQEAVANALKHGKPSSISITFLSGARKTVLSIVDDGKGIDDRAQPHAGIGLRTMAYRANMIGGKLQVKKTGKQGTKVTCTIEVIE